MFDQQGSCWLRRIFAALFLAGLLFLGFGFNEVSSAQAQAALTATPSPDISEIDQAIYKTIYSHIPSGLDPRIDHILIDGAWASSAVSIMDRKTGQTSGSMGLIVIANKVDDQWEVAYPGDIAFTAWLPSVPSSLISDESKQYFYDLNRSPAKEPLTSTSFNWKLPWPSGLSRCISGYGYNQGDHTGTNYYALDFGLSYENVEAVEAGTVVTVVTGQVNTYPNGPLSYGNYIVIDHGGILSLYAHLNNVYVSQNQSVPQGYIIGQSGDTGYSDGAHLHFRLADSSNNPILPEPMSGYTGFIGFSCNSKVYYTSDNVGPAVGNVGGLVLDSSTNQGLGGATVSASTGGTVATTDTNGAYILYSVPAGNTTITASQIDHGTASITFNVIANMDQQAPSISLIPGLCTASKVTTSCQNQAPNTPTLLNPGNGSSQNSSPLLCWQNNGDSDGDPVTFQVSVWGTASAQSNWISATCWSPPSLPIGSYSWNVIAQDPGGLKSVPSQNWGFNVTGPSSSDGIQLCSGTNFGTPCQIFTYTNDSTCINLASSGWADQAQSLQFLGSYIGNYDVILYHDNSCAIYNARYGSDASDLGAFDKQIASIQLQAHRSPSDGVQLCSGTNYGTPCQLFTYTSDSTCINLADTGWADQAQSLQFLGSYVGNYDLILYHDNNCSIYNARYGSDASDLGAFDKQIASIQFQMHRPPQNQPPNSPTPLSPGNTTIQSATPEFCWQNNGDPDGDPVTFQVSIWGPTNLESNWISSPCWTSPTLQSGAYSWSVVAQDSAGLQSTPSPSWLFTVQNCTSCGLADSGWPMIHADLQHDGRSIHVVPDVTGIVWTYAVAGPGINTSPTDAVEGVDGTVYVGSSDSNLYALRPDGTLKWKYYVGKVVSGAPTVAADGTIYFIGVTSDYHDALYAVNWDGSLKWSVSYWDGNWLDSPPTIGADGTIYVGSAGYLYAVAPDGSLRWTYAGDDMSSVAVTPDNIVYGVGMDSTGMYLYSLNLDGSERWKYRVSGQYNYGGRAPVVGQNGDVYFGRMDGKLYAVRKDGTLDWSYQTGGEVLASPGVGADGTIYFGSEDGYVYALNPTGGLLWQLYIVSRDGSPAIDANGILYFSSYNNNYLYAIYPNGTVKWQLSLDSYTYNSPAIGSNGMIYLGMPDGQLLAIGSSIFNDVPANYWDLNWIQRLYNSGITSGCIASPLSYCPDDPVTRAQMAVFLERGLNGPSYSPPAAIGTIFTDVPGSYWAAAWIEKLAADGITGGCGVGVYCPDNSVTRAQMAVFLLKSEHGSGYTPPPATGSKFTDVPASYWAASWIEQLANEGITSGCGTNLYCPDQSVTRAQMAVFLVKTFNLP